MHARSQACLKARHTVFHYGALVSGDAQLLRRMPEQLWVGFERADVVGAVQVVFEKRQQTGQAQRQLCLFARPIGGEA